MFWGKGDTSKLGDNEQKTLADLRRLVETGHLVSLSPEQSETALRALTFYAQFESAYRVIKMLRNGGALVGLMLLAWWTSADKLVEAFFGKGGP